MGHAAIDADGCMPHARVQLAEVQDVAVACGFCVWDNHQLQLVVWWLYAKLVAVRVRKVLQAIGVLEWMMYAAQCLRRGGPTHTAAAGVPLHYSMLTGKCKCYVVRQCMSYITMPGSGCLKRTCCVDVAAVDLC
jgi:hypothetical protein